MNVSDIAVVILAVLVALGLVLSVRVVKQYHLGVLFRLGRALGPWRPGLPLIVPVMNALHRVSLRVVMMPIHSPGTITRDNVSVDMSVVTYFLAVPARGAANG
jgi:regulator of protease activity HflC (stomatin/prohibitin superfamily)